MLVLASSQFASLAIAFTAAAGVVAALVALLKLRTEENESAVTQAQGAVETMAQLQDELRQALARANARADSYQADLARSRIELADLQRRYDEAIEHWGPFPHELKTPPAA